MAKRAPGVGEYNSSLQGLRKGDIPQSCVVCGGQEFFRRKAVDAYIHAIKGKHKGIDLIALQGPAAQGEKAATLSGVMEELTSRGLFASEKLVLVRRAQRVLFPLKQSEGDGGKSGGGVDGLVSFVSSPVSGMFVLFECDSLDRRGKLGKALAKGALVIDCPELRWEREVLQWLSLEARERGHNINSRASEMLFHLHGSDPGVLSGELDKLSVFLGDNQQIDEDAVKNFLGDSVALTGFELTNAVEAKDGRKALDAARRMVAQGLADSRGKKVELVGTVHMALGSLRNCMMRIWRAHDVVSRNGSLADIEQELGLRGRRAETMFGAGRKFSLREIRFALETLTTALESLHDTGGDPALTLERVALAACGKSR